MAKIARKDTTGGTNSKYMGRLLLGYRRRSFEAADL
jgi:hypothetical protein